MNELFARESLEIPEIKHRYFLIRFYLDDDTIDTMYLTKVASGFRKLFIRSELDNEISISFIQTNSGYELDLLQENTEFTSIEFEEYSLKGKLLKTLIYKNCTLNEMYTEYNCEKTWSNLIAVYSFNNLIV
ncbi:MAG: hypothetical protein KGH75_09835 [Rhodospirillales bacterium]|nr:hypothetical protein [Rhodospirillales bacterium]